MTLTHAGLDVTRIGGRIGAEISGVDLNHPLAGRTVAELTAALLAYKVLVFRSQHLDDPGQTRFASLFGPLTAAHPTIPSLDGDEHVLPVEGGEGARAPDDYGDLPRRLHRVTVAGDVPVGADGRRSYVIEGDEAAHYTPQAA